VIVGAPDIRPGSTIPASVAPFLARPVHDTPPPRSLRRSRKLHATLRYSSAEGMAAETITSCVGGAMLIAWAMYVGCGPVAIALLGALPYLAQLVQFPSAWLTSSLGSRRVAIAGFTIGRLIYAPLVALPFLPVSAGVQRLILVAVAATAAVFTVIGTNAWVAWMGEVVPTALRGRYFGKRLSLVTLGGATAALSAGLVLDVARRGGWEPIALSILAATACVAGTISLLLLRRHQDIPVDRRRAQARRRVDVGAIGKVVRDPAARPYLRYLVVWNLAIGVSATFFAVHMVQNLKMGFALIAAHGVAVAAMRILVSPMWGRLIGRFGARPVLIVCSFSLGLVPLVWLLPTPDFLFLPLALDVVLAGGLWAGHMLASFELPLATAPRDERPWYLAAYNTAGGLAFAAASIAGGALALALPDTLHLLGGDLADLQILFVISAVGRFSASPLALAVAEPRAQPVEALLLSLVARLQTRRARLARALVAIRR